MSELVMCSCGLAMYAFDTPDGWVYMCEDCDPELADVLDGEDDDG